MGRKDKSQRHCTYVTSLLHTQQRRNVGTPTLHVVITYTGTRKPLPLPPSHLSLRRLRRVFFYPAPPSLLSSSRVIASQTHLNSLPREQQQRVCAASAEGRGVNSSTHRTERDSTRLVVDPAPLPQLTDLLAMPAPILTAPKLQATSRQTRFNPSIEVKKELDLHDVNLAIISSASSSASSSSGAATNGSSHQRERRSGATPSGSGSSTPTASAAAAATVNSHHLVQKDILRDVHLQLNPGVRYVLHGLNGVGKSTLLKAIGERHIPGIPWGLRIRLLQQQQEEEQGQEEATEQWKVQGDRNVQQSAPSASGYSQHTPSTGEQGNPGDNAATTVLEYVVRSDKERQEAMERSEGGWKLLARCDYGVTERTPRNLCEGHSPLLSSKSLTISRMPYPPLAGPCEYDITDAPLADP